MNSLCPRCKSNKTELVRFAGVECIVCHICHYDERAIFEGFDDVIETSHVHIPL